MNDIRITVFCGLVGILGCIGCAPGVREYVYKTTPETELNLYVHFPPGWKQEDSRPAMVFFFGGGWRRGTVEHFRAQAEYFATRGMVTARADYRISSRHGVTPDKCVEDAKSAVRWIRSHAGELGVDPDRIVASGGSAGGHLAACTALTPDLEAEGENLSVSSKPNVMVLFNPALNLTSGKILELLGKRFPPELRDNTALLRLISPTQHLKKDSPPAILFYGTEDILLDHGMEFMKIAGKLNHRSEFHMVSGQGHGFFKYTPWIERTIRGADEFLISLGYLRGAPTIREGQLAAKYPPRTKPPRTFPTE